VAHDAAQPCIAGVPSFWTGSAGALDRLDRKDRFCREKRALEHRSSIFR
jgi:hypothetical protein